MKTAKVTKKNVTISSGSSSSVSTAAPTCGIKQAKDGVIFTVCYPSARTVQIAGTFNNWQPQQNSMQKINDKGFWQTKLFLSKGTYSYRLVVDGQWQHDPNNSNTEPNPYGSLNSILTVK
jgi:1,4-alpha-glucan branching enzyme